MSSAAEPTFELSREASTARRSMMRELITITARPGVISFAGGLPAPELFPVAEWQACTDHVLTTDGRRALQYGPPHGPLLEAIADLMRLRGADVATERIFVTTGAQQALHVVARLLMDADSTAVVDRFVFTGVRQAFGGPDRELREVPGTPEEGLDPDAFAAAVAADPKPRAAVVVPNFHNPMGTTLDEARRDAVVAATGARGVPLIEDDPYGLLGFDGAARPALLDRAPERALYIGSFSKIIAPALRLGWIVAPPELVGRLRVLKESVDLETSALTQRVAARFLAEGCLGPHLERVRAEYRVRRDAMVAGLEEHMPAGSRWSTPGGGMFLWVELPAGADTLALLTPAVEAGVAFVPGAAFTSGPAPRTMRLNFSNATPAAIATGLARLGQAVRATGSPG